MSVGVENKNKRVEKVYLSNDNTDVLLNKVFVCNIRVVITIFREIVQEVLFKLTKNKKGNHRANVDAKQVFKEKGIF